MFDGILTLKLGGFRNSKPIVKEYLRKIEEKEEEKSAKSFKYFENTYDWKVQLGMPFKMCHNWDQKRCL